MAKNYYSNMDIVPEHLFVLIVEQLQKTQQMLPDDEEKRGVATGYLRMPTVLRRGIHDGALQNAEVL